MNVSLKILLLGLLFPLALPAQDLFGGDRLTSVNNLVVDMIRSQSTGGIQGSPYPRQDFVRATVFLANGDTLEHELRYNAVLDEMEFVRDEQLYVIGNKYRIQRLQLGEKTYWVCPKFEEGAAPGMGYFELVVDGTARLYVQHLRAYLPEKRPNSGYEQYQPPRFVAGKPTYFIQAEPTTAPVRVADQKKVFLTDFAGLIPDLEGMMRREKIKFNDEGLMALVELLNRR